MSTISRQLRDWCSGRGFELCDDLVRKLDDALLSAGALAPEILLEACRSLSTGFFRHNGVDREEAATELAAVLEMPVVRAQLVRHLPNRPDRAQRVPNDANSPDVFLSYYHEDSEFVCRLATTLAENGYVPWYDRTGLTGGTSFPSVIERALQRARYVGLVATEAAMSRPWVRLERDATLVREGEEDREILVPLRIDGTELPLFVRTKTWCDFRGSFETGLAQLMDALSR